MKTVLSILFLLSAFVPVFSTSAFADEDKRITPVFGYTWPFPDRDMKAEIGEAPLLLELFSDQRCMYCPPADLFINDLIRKVPGITVLSYHVVDQRRKNPEPLSKKDSHSRQMFYSIVERQALMTPQVVVNGHGFVKGHMYKEVLDAIKSRENLPPVFHVDIKAGKKKGTHVVHLPAVPLGKFIEGFDDHVIVRLVEYLKPARSPVKDGPNEGFDPEYLHVVSSVTDLEPWTGEEREYSFTWNPSKKAAGAVLLLDRRDTGLVGFGEIKKR